MNKANTANQVWYQMIHDIVNGGMFSSPRDKPCKELLGHRVIVSLQYPVIVEPLRKMGYRFMAASAAWMLTGDNRVETIRPYSSTIADFSDDGKTFFGAYGPKIRDQI